MSVQQDPSTGLSNTSTTLLVSNRTTDTTEMTNVTTSVSNAQVEAVETEPVDRRGVSLHYEESDDQQLNITVAQSD